MHSLLRDNSKIHYKQRSFHLPNLACYLGAVKLLQLIEADIYRDGGSYGARFETDENIDYCLWLQCLQMSNDEGLQHRDLFEYRGTERPDNCSPVTLGSEADQQIILRIQEFLAHPQLSPDPWLTIDNRVTRLTEMLHYMPRRKPLR